MILFCLAPDLHYLCTRKAASRHNIQSSLAVLPQVCVVFTEDRSDLFLRTNNYIP